MFLKKKIFLTFIIIIISIATFAYLKIQFNNKKNQTTQIGGNFELTNHLGENVTNKNFKNSYRLVFFGFTNCPDFCPNTLIRIGSVMEQIDSKKNLRVSFIGKPNVGKSTLINAVIKEERMITSENAGTTLDAVEIKFKIRKNIYSLYDTAGLLRKSKTISKIQKFSITQTLNTIKDTDLCLLVLNAEDGINKQDKIILNLIQRHNKAFFIIVNKIDKISQIDMKKLKRDIRYLSNIANKARCIFVSAAMKKNINKISSMIISVSNMLYIRYKPSKLTQILNEATSKHQPPIYNKKRPKLKFAQQSKFKDLIIHIYGNGIKNLSPSYQKYLSNYFLEELNLLGIPLELKFTQKKEPI